MPRTDVPAGWRATAACIAAGLAVWVGATLLRALDWRSFGPGHLVIGYLVYAADWTFIPCIGIGLPSTAIALWLRSRSSARRAVTGGLAVGAIGFTVFAISFGAGTAAVSGIAPILLILAAELWLAFKLRARWSRPSTA
jgi:hypothetical protein